MRNEVLSDSSVSPFMVHIAVENKSDQRSLVLVDLQNALFTLISSRPDPVPIGSLTTVITPLPGLFDPSGKSLGKDIFWMQN
jgi:hypothetical protein